MYASYHQVRTPRRAYAHAHPVSAVLSRALRGTTLWVVLASLVVCGALGWLTYEICNRTDVAGITLQTDMPRNVIDMHNFYS